jgi:hypothetical protein
MVHIRGRVAPVAVAAAVLVGGANLTAYAVNGHPLLIGKSNSETSTLTLVNNGKGPALRLKSGKTSAPLAVNTSKRVRSLNADQVDGKSAKALETHPVTYTIPGATTMPFSFQLNGLPAGSYIGSFNIAATTGSTSVLVCNLSSGNTVNVLDYGSSSGFIAVSSASALLAKHNGTALDFSCSDGTAIYPGPEFSSTVTLTPVDKPKHGSSAPTIRTPVVRGLTGH